MDQNEVQETTKQLTKKPEIDPNTNEQLLKTTNRTCTIAVINQWGSDIKNVTFQHSWSGGEKATTIFETTLKYDTTSNTRTVTYETGVSAKFDYWFVNFTDSSDVMWRCKNNFYCLLEKEDENANVRGVIDGASKKLKILMNSSGCEAEIYRVVSSDNPQ